MNRSRFLLLALVILLACTLPLQGQASKTASSFQCFATDTFATGLNDAGQVVGWYGPFDSGKGFIKKKSGDCEKLPMYPNSLATIPLGINDPGQIVGIFFSEQFPNGSGFLYEKGNFTQILYPGTQTCQTFAFSINNRGQIVGLYDLWKPGNGQQVCDGPDRPFLREANGTFATIPYPDTWPDSVQANGINPRGMIIGNYLLDEKEYGFLLDAKGGVSTITVPGAVDVMPTGLNPQGQIVGRYFTEPWLSPVGPCHSFFLDSKGAKPVEIKYPNATYTCIGTINAPGEVSGAWTNNYASGPWYGFVADLEALLPPTP